MHWVRGIETQQKPCNTRGVVAYDILQKVVLDRDFAFQKLISVMQLIIWVFYCKNNTFIQLIELVFSFIS